MTFRGKKKKKKKERHLMPEYYTPNEKSVWNWMSTLLSRNPSVERSKVIDFYLLSYTVIVD